MSKVDVHFCKSQIIRLFNEGVLTIFSANWFAMQGFAIICNSGEVVDIVAEET